MNPAAALELLQAHSPVGETWPIHCRQVARVARCLADALNAAGSSVDADAIEAQALVHDIGRSVNHGYLHGWEGFQLMEKLGHAATGRGCIMHWLKGRSREELLQSKIPSEFLEQVLASLNPPQWQLADSVISLADSSVAGVQIVPLAFRHEDLRKRYGSSAWLDRHSELADQHAVQISAALGYDVAQILAPLYGTQL